MQLVARYVIMNIATFWKKPGSLPRDNVADAKVIGKTIADIIGLCSEINPKILFLAVLSDGTPQLKRKFAASIFLPPYLLCLIQS